MADGTRGHDCEDQTQTRAAIDEGDLRVERLTALAVKVFGNQGKAMRWLRRPRREFGGVCALEMMETEAAARQVELMLNYYDEDRGT